MDVPLGMEMMSAGQKSPLRLGWRHSDVSRAPSQWVPWNRFFALRAKLRAWSLSVGGPVPRERAPEQSRHHPSGVGHDIRRLEEPLRAFGLLEERDELLGGEGEHSRFWVDGAGQLEEEQLRRAVT